MRLQRKVQTIIESVPAVIDVSAAQAASLNYLGKTLASKKMWWGEEEPDENHAEKRIVRCSPRDDGHWDIVVLNAVGVIATDDLELFVEPKIPTRHAVYLLSRSEQFPRVADVALGTEIETGDLLWRALAEWFLSSVEKVLRGELIRDYRVTVDALREVRGRVDVSRTTCNFFTGNLKFECEYEEFDSDNPLNRILRAAVVIVQQIPGLDDEIRDRAARALLRFNDVGAVRSSDLRARVDRHVKRYEDAIGLARNIILGVGRGLDVGQSRARCFLLRTPELIEAGIREVLMDALLSWGRVGKRSRQIPGTTMSLNPDLVFGEVAIGDVKYKIANEWNRSDIYQAMSFALGFGVKRCALFSFSQDEKASEESVVIGDISLTRFKWPTKTTPANAEHQVVESVRAWLRES